MMNDVSHATPELFAALAAAHGELENASKNAANPHFRSKYADLAECLNTARPVLAKHGLSIVQFPAFDGAMAHVTTMLSHSSGGYVMATASCVPAKSDAQGIGAATTYLRRYGYAAMAGIAQEDDDGTAAAHDKRPAAKPAYPAAQFSKNLPKWWSLIASGQKSVDDLIATLQSKASFTAEQLEEIRNPPTQEEQQ